jgi:hypothetical protein
VTINNTMPKINDFLTGFQDNLPGMKDFRHASRLYLDDNFKLAPKNKFLFHVVFHTDETLFYGGFNSAERRQLNMLVKNCDLPKYGMNLEEKVQYNKKMYAATRINYEPVNIVFHDDQADTVNAFWKKYYEYYIADSVGMNDTNTVLGTKDDTYDPIGSKHYSKFGMDTPVKRKKPYLRSIQMFVLHKQRFTSMTLVNPVIGSFAHDNMDQADGTGIMSNTMSIYYETVIYASGGVSRGGVPGFATINYDKEPSPLGVLGRGANSIFGPGGIVDGIGSAVSNWKQGNFLGAILGAVNTYNNAKKMKKSDVKEELKGIAKKGILEVGKQAGSISNPIAQFAVGAVAIAGIHKLNTNTKGTNDQQNKANTKRISAPKLDTTLYLTADEAYNLVSTNSTVRSEVAGSMYYKDIGSRKGLTVAQSDIEFAGSNATTQRVYQNKAITNVRKLVTEGYLRISRQTLDVNIATEKATI